MHGMEHAACVLLGDLDRELVDRDSYSYGGPCAIGRAVFASIRCTSFCGFSINSFHTLVSDVRYETSYSLATLVGTGLYAQLGCR